jgi:hypothetical protein
MRKGLKAVERALPASRALGTLAHQRLSSQVGQDFARRPVLPAGAFFHGQQDVIIDR